MVRAGEGFLPLYRVLSITSGRRGKKKKWAPQGTKGSSFEEKGKRKEGALGIMKSEKNKGFRKKE